MSFDDLFKAASTLKEVNKSISVPTPHGTLQLPPCPDGIQFSFDLQTPHQAIFIGPGSDPIKVARQAYVAGAGRWLSGIIDKITVVLIVPKQISLLKQVDEWIFSRQVNVHSRTEKVSLEALQLILKYSICFELNRSHRWISVGPEIFTLSVDDIIKTPNQTGHKNVAVLTVEHTSQYIMIRMQVRRYFPIDVEDMKKSNESSFHVYVLPTLSEGLCSNTTGKRRNPPAFLRTPTALSQYWLENHGLDIPPHVAETTVDISLSSGRLELTYPAVCVWRNRWSFLPFHTKQYIPMIRERLTKELEQVKQLWSWKNIDVGILRPIPLSEISMEAPKSSRLKPQKRSENN
jgi:hypothetical protein